MKITLNKTQRTEISNLREQLAAALEDINTNAAEEARLIERQQKLQAEITALENSDDSESDAAASKLATKRVQLEQVSKKLALASVPADVSAEDQAGTIELLKRFARAASAAAMPIIETHAAEIAVAIRGWCVDDTNAKGIAYTMPAARSLAQTYSRRFGDFGVTVLELKAAIARADELLSGELAWTWNSTVAVSK